MYFVVTLLEKYDIGFYALYRNIELIRFFSNVLQMAVMLC